MKIIHLAFLLVTACTQTSFPETNDVYVAPDAARAVLPPVLCPAGVPASLAPPLDVMASFALQGKGEQRYSCVGNSGIGYTWTFVAPNADLFSVVGQRFQFGHHAAGPTWRALDGSQVTAGKVAGVTVEPSAIDWLLLKTNAIDGDGFMSAVKYIQRLSTQNGLAPLATTCNADTVGKVVEIPYQALYVFYVEGSSGVRCNAY